MAKHYTKPKLRERIKNRIMRGSKGGRPGQWSARKSQLLVKAYEKAGGGYRGGKTKAAKSLTRWTKQKWRTGGGAKGKTSKESGGRYLPDKAWKSLSRGEKAAVNRSKKKGGGVGKTVKISKRISKKVAKHRK